jgi:Holliday junction resolvase-like predicted endonuclease
MAMQGGVRNDALSLFEGDSECVAALLAVGIDPTVGPTLTFAAVDAYKRETFPALCEVEDGLESSRDRVMATECPRNAEELAKRAQIIAGLAKQRPKPGKNLKTYDDIIHGYRLVVANLEQQEPALRAAAEVDARWMKWKIAYQSVQKHREMWAAADKEVGAISNKNGATLESRKTEIVEEVCKREQLDMTKCNVWSNVYWNDNPSLGECDIVIERPVESGGGLILAEVKARVYDVMEGMLQSGEQRNLEKTFLTLNGKQVHVPRKANCYVALVLPPNPYLLQFESKVKRLTSWRLKHPETTDAELWEKSKVLGFESREQPLHWYRRHRDFIVLLP